MRKQVKISIKIEIPIPVEMSNESFGNVDNLNENMFRLTNRNSTKSFEAVNLKNSFATFRLKFDFSNYHYLTNGFSELILFSNSQKKKKIASDFLYVKCLAWKKYKIALKNRSFSKLTILIDLFNFTIISKVSLSSFISINSFKSWD